MSTERDAFIASIVRQPDEDHSRLVFADWLDETGREGDAARAEMIRWQIESRVDFRREGGRWRNKASRGVRMPPESFWQTLNGFLSEPLSSVFVVSRGFISEIHLPCAAFIADDFAKELFRAQPIERVVLTDKEPMLNGWEEHQGGSVQMSWRLPRAIMRVIGNPHMNSLGPHRTRKSFPTDDAARRALSRACVAWGRAQAGLPAWEPQKLEAA